MKEAYADLLLEEDGELVVATICSGCGDEIRRSGDLDVLVEALMEVVGGAESGGMAKYAAAVAPGIPKMARTVQKHAGEGTSKIGRLPLPAFALCAPCMTEVRRLQELVQEGELPPGAWTRSVHSPGQLEEESADEGDTDG